MKENASNLTQQLFDQNCLSAKQLENITEYRSRGLFSLRVELTTFLYISIMMFTTGVGILIYKNIETIGHSILLIIILLVASGCFYFSFKNSTGFRKNESSFTNPLFDYLVLAANLLFCVFVGYLQFQYQVFGTYYGISTLLPTFVTLFSAYYFDNKSVLSIGITGLAAFFGLSVTPQTLLDSGNYSIDALSYTAILFGFGLLAWTYYSFYHNLKTHFALLFNTFALHLIFIACITNMFKEYWFVSALILVGAGFLFHKKSYQLESVSILVFTVIYSYISLNILIYKIIETTDTLNFFIIFAYLAPLYFIGSIVLFIQLVKKFRTRIFHDSI